MLHLQRLRKKMKRFSRRCVILTLRVVGFDPNNSPAQVVPTTGHVGRLQSGDTKTNDAFSAPMGHLLTILNCPDR